MKIYPAVFAAAMVLCAVGCANGKKTYKYDYLYAKAKFDMPRVERPVFPGRAVDLRDFGGNPDGVALNTAAFDKAMAALAEKGGGTLTVPAGVWFTGPIVFRANVNMHLETGALILFSSDFDLYPLVGISFEGLDTRRCQSPISGRGLTNVAITGEGSINGSGQDWRPVKRDKVTERQWKQIIARGGVMRGDDYWFPSAGSRKGFEISDMNVPLGLATEEQWLEVKDFLRPVMVSFEGCRNVLLEGVLFENSPAWNIHPLMCENVIVDNISVRNPGFSQNGDGLDIESCRNVIVVNSSFDVGDDAICIKSGKDEDGRRRAMPTENVLIDNCKVFQGHGGFVVGSEMSSGARNISVSNCQFMGTDVGLRFKSTRGRGGVVENIFIDNVTMFDIATEALLFDLYYNGKSAVETMEEGAAESVKRIPEVDETTPAFRNIYVDNLICRNARRAMYFNGLPEMNIENINVSNVWITSKVGAQLTESKDICFRNINIVPAKGPALILHNISNFSGEGIECPQNMELAVVIIGNSQQILLPGMAERKIVHKE